MSRRTKKTTFKAHSAGAPYSSPYFAPGVLARNAKATASFPNNVGRYVRGRVVDNGILAAAMFSLASLRKRSGHLRAFSSEFVGSHRSQSR